jgi:hypothetical protein
MNRPSPGGLGFCCQAIGGKNSTIVKLKTMKIKTQFFILTLLLLWATHAQPQERPAGDFFKRIEVGTNILPLIDSTTLRFDNLQIKYFYGKHRNNAFRLSLLPGSFMFASSGNYTFSSSFIYRSRFSIQAGHIWYYKLNEKVRVYNAIDVEFSNSSNNSYSDDITHLPYRISRWNEYAILISPGIKYNFYKNFSLEVETTLLLFFEQYYSNFRYHEGVYTKTNTNKNNYVNVNYIPLRCLTLNYKF